MLGHPGKRLQIGERPGSVGVEILEIAGIDIGIAELRAETAQDAWQEVIGLLVSQFEALLPSVKTTDG